MEAILSAGNGREAKPQAASFDGTCARSDVQGPNSEWKCRGHSELRKSKISVTGIWSKQKIIIMLRSIFALRKWGSTSNFIIFTNYEYNATWRTAPEIKTGSILNCAEQGEENDCILRCLVSDTAFLKNLICMYTFRTYSQGIFWECWIIHCVHSCVDTLHHQMFIPWVLGSIRWVYLFFPPKWLIILWFQFEGSFLKVPCVSSEEYSLLLGILTIRLSFFFTCFVYISVFFPWRFKRGLNFLKILRKSS